MGPAVVQLRPWRVKPNVRRQTPGGREGKGLSSAFMLSSSESSNQITLSISMEKRMGQEPRKFRENASS